MRDLRYALRGLRRQPLFTLAAVLTIAVGIGAHTAIFSLLYQVLLRPLPYAHEDRLVFVWNSYPRTGLPQASVSIPDYLDRRTQAPAIEDAALFTQRSLSLAEGGSPEQVRALRVTPSFFSTLGRAPMLGRAFADADATTGADRETIVRMVLGQGVRTAVAGVTVGLAGAVALTRFLESQLYGVGTRDLTVFAAAGSLLLMASIVACYLPARGSTRIDPMVALRDS